MSTHWKQNFNYAYTGAYELEKGQEKTLTIKETKTEEVTSTDGKKQICFVAYFTESSKPMILNKTNCKTISKIYGPYVENWTGKMITIKAESVKAFGEVVDALRVKNVKPEIKKIDYTPQITQLRACTSIEQLAIVFKSFSPDQQKATVTIKDEMKTLLSTLMKI